jgi:hypothetical protein
MYQNPEESMISGNAITVLNASEVLSMEFPAQAILMPMANGWNMVVQQDCRVSVTFKTGARRIEIQLSTGDEIYRDHQDIIISRKAPAQTERRYRTVGITGTTATSARTESSYAPPDYSELIQQVRDYVMQDLENMMRQAQQPQPSEGPPEEGEPQEG